jgi:hypothetical protein
MTRYRPCDEESVKRVGNVRGIRVSTKIGRGNDRKVILSFLLCLLRI